MIASVLVFPISALPRLPRAASSSYARLPHGSRSEGSRRPLLGPARTPDRAMFGQGHLSGTLLSP